MMFSGKSTVGPILSEKLGWTFNDLDEEIKTHAGQSIQSLFKEQGETGFRSLESKLLKKSILKSGQVIATGGGIVLNKDNRHLLQESGTVIFLKTDLKTLLQRSKQIPDHDRPLMDSEDPAARLTKLLSKREPLYERVAHITIKTEHKTASRVADEIFQTIKPLK